MDILLSGASTGIGRAFAERMLADGHAVWGIARNASILSDLAQRHGTAFRWSAVDVTDAAAVQLAVADIKGQGFVPDAVVLNAGIYPHDSDGTFRYDVAERVIATNVNGAFVFVDLFLPLLLKRGSGQFLAVSSILAERPDPHGASYSASKAALAMAFRSFALRYRGAGVEFKTIVFGPVASASATAGRRRPAASAHIPTCEQAAGALARALRSKSTCVHYPRWLGLVFRALAWLPDRTFHALTKPFRR